MDVIAPADILKQIFKIPYSKARVSIAVHRVGQTLILNSGPDIEEGEKLIRRHNTKSKCVDQSLFLNFAMHSVRMEACDCPPTHAASSKEKPKSSVLPDEYKSKKESFESLNHPIQGHGSIRQSDEIGSGEGFIRNQEYPQVEKEKLFWEKTNKRTKAREAIKVSQIKEKPRRTVQESEKYRRVSNDEFLRMLFWQFHNFRMLLGSDLLIFSNEKYIAVSLHLWDVSRQVSPLSWLEAWLDNFMASVPELAICYHQDGVVQGYELLKTDEIFLLKGISEDGTPAFHPHVVQQNGLSVLRFLQENCEQDPGAYWLYKSAGEDVIQLFDLSVIPKNHPPDNCDDNSDPLPSLMHRRRSDSILSLGTLLYRIAHRLSLSMSHGSRERCVVFFKKCLDLLEEPDHQVVRALAHEQFARLLLTYNEELELTSEALPLESEVIIADAEEESFEFMNGLYASNAHDIVYPPFAAVEPNSQENFDLENSTEMISGDSIAVSSGIAIVADEDNVPSSSDEDFMVCNVSKTSDHEIQTVADPISSKLAAIHHVSQAIKSLRWTRRWQSTKPELNHKNEIEDEPPSSMDFSVCACGDTDCIEVCDIRDWLPTSKLDDKLWKLVLLLGESYLALGEAYKDDGQLYQALKVVELACLVYGSMPHDTRFISSMVCSSLSHAEVNIRSENMKSFAGDDHLAFGQLSSNYLFWAKAWTLVGDIFVDFYLVKGEDASRQAERKDNAKDLRMSSEVLKEVERLKKKLGQFNQNCSLCSLVNCSCQSDRASSGSSASSSTQETRSSGYGRKQFKKSYITNSNYSRPVDYENVTVAQNGDIINTKESKHLKHNKTDKINESSNRIADAMQDVNLAAEVDVMGSRVDTPSEPSSKGKTAVKNGGIFKYLRCSIAGDADYTLSVALSCYEEARKSMSELPASSAELKSVVKKKGWVCNELGRYRVERKDLGKAEIAFAEAISSFIVVEDHTNIILINCNLGHGRRALAEEMVLKIESLKEHAVFHSAYLQAVETAKMQYSESLRYYGAAKTELNSLAENEGSVSSSLKNEVNTQFAHTYLRLGMLLAREDTVAEIYENGVLEDYSVSSLTRTQREHRKHEISANDAIRAAVSIYESLGELRRQEAAYAYFQLACYQRNCCLKFLEPNRKKNNLAKGENSVVQRVKQYASLAERNWQKSLDFYTASTHPLMHLTILIERSALLFSLSSYLHSNVFLESALSLLLEGRNISENKSLSNDNPEICAKFWSQLQMLLKSMLATTRSTKTNKSSVSPQQTPLNKSVDANKLRELYKISLKSTNFSQLHDMHRLWAS
ncbi:uncharacterized protein LOC111372473 [Olea europaea subsp. europaea]|nr:uncharacterized protein LOC111372473 [Olea europaea subsp. europaea]